MVDALKRAYWSRLDSNLLNLSCFQRAIRSECDGEALRSIGIGRKYQSLIVCLNRIDELFNLSEITGFRAGVVDCLTANLTSQAEVVREFEIDVITYQFGCEIVVCTGNASAGNTAYRTAFKLYVADGTLLKIGNPLRNAFDTDA